MARRVTLCVVIFYGFQQAEGLSGPLTMISTLFALLLVGCLLLVRVNCEALKNLMIGGGDGGNLFDFILPGGEQSKNKPIYLKKFQGTGKAFLIVNVASACGYTDSNYKDLASLQRLYGPRGLIIITVPCNDFGAQEPGSDTEILDFARQTYDYRGLMSGKVGGCLGTNKHPLFQAFIEQTPLPELTWNFFKFLADSDGNLVGAYAHDVLPSALSPVIEEVLSRSEHRVDAPRPAPGEL